MGRTKKGLNGSVVGKVGPHVFYQWKGIDCVRTRPRVNKNRKLSSDETKNRGKFAYVQRFLSNLTVALRLGFHNYKENQTAFNSAMSYTLTNAVRSDEEGFYIDHSALRISKGIPSPLNEVTLTYEDDILTCDWDYDKTIVTDLHLAGFRSLLLFMSDDELTFNGNILDKAMDDKKEQIRIPRINDVDTIYHVHLGFVATDHSSRRIDSVYIGTITI
ncbi:DUF6266 family protein [Sphingobacterium pedocola]|uniref:Uncharacterized protein n=1 Tax=Sphingobacterium pedocola TaxID=2082722 RepID=A0ABR9T3S5_9SPHI|nr:DUF6266 family protein [Sphingobacterium pedocola]MBE8720001.1 hypothetical protein [Sphingobacterium pedocola]